MSRHKEYVINDVNDEFLFVGTAKECADYLGLTIGSFYSVVTRNDRKKYSIHIVENGANDET